MEREIDILNRDKFVEVVIDFIAKLSHDGEYCSFAIDGDWGIGKTFVVKMLNERLLEDNYTVLNYNCWESSFYDDPLEAILYSVLNELYKVDYLQESKNEYLKIVKKIATMLNGVIKGSTGLDILNSFDNDADEFQSIVKQVKCIKDIISKNTSNKPIVIIVDEIDRCLPEYAIKVLERIYLIFNELPNVFVITTMDKRQLVHSIKKVFGNSVSIEGYLRKFISFTMPLDNGEIDYSVFDKYKYYFEKHGISEEEITETAFIFEHLIKDVGARGLDIVVRRTDTIHRLIRVDKININIICAELVISAIYFVNSNFDETIFNPQKTIRNIIDNADEMSIINFFRNLTKGNQIGGGDDRCTGKKILYNSIEEMTLWLCNCTVDDIQTRDLGTYYYLNNYDVQIGLNMDTMKKFYDMLKYIK